jgi:hypothetical protein
MCGCRGSVGGVLAACVAGSLYSNRTSLLIAVDR